MAVRVGHLCALESGSLPVRVAALWWRKRTRAGAASGRRHQGLLPVQCRTIRAHSADHGAQQLGYSHLRRSTRGAHRSSLIRRWSHAVRSRKPLSLALQRRSASREYRTDRDRYADGFLRAKAAISICSATTFRIAEPASNRFNGCSAPCAPRAITSSTPEKATGQTLQTCQPTNAGAPRRRDDGTSGTGIADLGPLWSRARPRTARLGADPPSCNHFRARW